MSIHEQIRKAREGLGWSMERLAKEVSDAEGLAKPLTWQAVQQWENGTSAPKRTRMQVVKRLLKLDEAERAAQKGEVFEALSPSELAMLENYRKLLDKDRKAIDLEVAAKAEERQAEMDELLARYGVAKAAERANARRSSSSSTTSAKVGGQLKQGSLLDDQDGEEVRREL
jgi:transcriptional regulator with XRE-family HTH domain